MFWLAIIILLLPSSAQAQAKPNPAKLGWDSLILTTDSNPIKDDLYWGQNPINLFAIVVADSKIILDKIIYKLSWERHTRRYYFS